MTRNYFSKQLFAFQKTILLLALLLVQSNGFAQVLDAVDDYAHKTLADANGIVLTNVLSNDFNGTASPIAPNLVTLTVLSQSSPFVNLVNRNVVTSFPGGILQAGTYTITYQICRVNNPAVCDSATATLIVSGCQAGTAPQITSSTASICHTVSDAQMTGLPTGVWIAKVKRNGVNYRTQTGSGTTGTIANLPRGASYYEIAIADMATGCQSPYSGFETTAYDCGITTQLTGVYADFNNDGQLSAGDKFNYSLVITNNIAPEWHMENVSIFAEAQSPNLILNTSQTLALLPYGSTSTNFFTISYNITQADITRGYVPAEVGIFSTHGIHDYSGAASTINWLNAIVPASAVLSGNATICSGGQTNLSVTITGGSAPFTVVYTDGSSNFSVPNYSSGNPIVVNPSANTAYTLVSVTGSNAAAIGNLSGSAAISVQQQYPFYTDADGDGYGTGQAANLCAPDAATPPNGYATVDGDCDDDDAAVNPEAAEILYNGIDDNCSGTIDEGNQITTSLLASVRNTTVATMNTLIGITTLAPASAYNGWRIRLTSGSQVQTIERNVPNFALSQFPTYNFATTYTVEIELRRNGVWLGYYGQADQITSPAVVSNGPVSQIGPSQCGITLAQINTLIATTSIAGVTGYRFRVTNLTDTAGPNTVQTIDRSQNWFSLPMLSRYNYGTTYKIEVALKIGSGTFGNYGTSCEVSSPSAPQLANCGGTIASGTSYVSTASLSGATQYRFEVKRESDNLITTLDRNLPYFIFNSIPASAFTAGASYTVRVAVMTTGVWSPFGSSCSIVAPGSTARNAGDDPIADSTIRKITAYPNPFVLDFILDLDTADASPLHFSVYDMLGRLTESGETTAPELASRPLGQQYPTGVYNVVISQNGTIKTLRVIKR